MPSPIAAATAREMSIALHHPEEQIFPGRTLEAALTWCLMWLMALEIGLGQFLV